VLTEVVENEGKGEDGTDGLFFHKRTKSGNHKPGHDPHARLNDLVNTEGTGGFAATSKWVNGKSFREKGSFFNGSGMS